MDLRRYKDIVGIRSESGQYLAFHTRNLEVAEVDQSVWQTLVPQSQAGGEVLEELNSWNSEESTTVRSGQVSFGIRSITINTTQLCNLHCRYCAAGGDGTYGQPISRIEVDKTLPQLKSLLEKVPSGESFAIHFMGGEPLIYPQAIREIAQYATLLTAGRNIAIKYMVTTNGTLISSEILQLLTSIKCHVQVSLDGPPEVNDLQRPTRGGKGSTPQTMMGLDRLIERRDELRSIGISAVFDSKNTEVLRAYEFFRKYDVDWYELTFSYTDKNPEASAKYTSEMEQIAALAFSHGGEDELRKIRTFDKYFKVLDQQQRIENYCGAGKSFLMVDAKNQLYSCPWDVGKDAEIVGRDSELDMEKLKSYENPLVESNSCQSCWARYLCGGGCMFTHQQATGSKNKVDIEFCKRTRSLIARAIVYYEQCRGREV